MGTGNGDHQVNAVMEAVSDRLLELTGEISAAANRMRLGQAPAQTSASAHVSTGTSTAYLVVGIVGVFAIVVAVACVAVVAAWRDADSRVFEAQTRMQAERNEQIEDRLGIVEAQLRRINREAEAK